MMAGVKKSKPNCTNPSLPVFLWSKQSHGKAQSQGSREYIFPMVVEQDREWMFLNTNLIGHNLLGTVSSLSSKIRHKGESIPISKRTWLRTRNQMSFWTLLKMFSLPAHFSYFFSFIMSLSPLFPKSQGCWNSDNSTPFYHSFTHFFMSIEWLLYAKHHAER